MDEASDVLQFPLERGQGSFVHHRLKQRSPLCYLYLIMKLYQMWASFHYFLHCHHYHHRYHRHHHCFHHHHRHRRHLRCVVVVIVTIVDDGATDDGTPTDVVVYFPR